MSEVTGKHVYDSIGDLLNRAEQTELRRNIAHLRSDGSLKLRIEQPLEKLNAALNSGSVRLPAEHEAILTDRRTVGDWAVFVVAAHSRPEDPLRYPPEAGLSLTGFISGRGLEVKVRKPTGGEELIAITSLGRTPLEDPVYALCIKLMAKQPQDEQAALGLEIVALAKIALGFGR